jgi:hypothetical protein
MQSQSIHMQLQSQSGGLSGHRLHFRMQGNLIGDPTNTRRIQSNFKETPIALTTTKPLPSRHVFLVQYSDPQSYGEAAGNPFLESANRRSTTPSSRTRLGIWFPFLLGGNFSNADGSIGPRVQQMDRSTDTKLGLSPKAFNRFMVLTMMRPFLQ